MNYLGANMKLIIECSQKLVRLGENLCGKEQKLNKAEPLDVPTMTTDFVKEHGLPCPNGYIFKDENDNVINATKIVLEKKKKGYPKTYEECCKVLGVNPSNYLTIRNVLCYAGEEEIIKYERDLLNKFVFLWELHICRNAYWKIAGEENKGNIDYVICNVGGKIISTNIPNSAYNHILAFPTAEMRDAFYENFKELIETVKELL